VRRPLHSYEETYLGEVARRLPAAAPGTSRRDSIRYGRNLLENDFPPIYDLEHLAYVTDTTAGLIETLVKEPEAYYSEFRISKRGGGSRLIAAPSPALKTVQHWIQRNITQRLWLHPACHGYRRGRSIVTNAGPHVAAPLVVKYDLVGFFGSIPAERVFRIFRRVGFAVGVADSLAKLTTVRGRLPQGAPTSPDLANFAAYGLDARLGSFASRNGVAYTRYADDLTFSGGRIDLARSRRLIERVVRDEGFRPNQAKVRFLTRASQQRVTGVVVNEKLNSPRARRRWIRQELHYVRKFGVDAHLAARGIDPSGYKEFIYGHALALKQVNSTEGVAVLSALDSVDWPY